MTMMDQLVARGWALIEMAIDRMQKDGAFATQFIVVAPDGSADIFIPPPETANNPLLKEAMVKTLQELGRVAKPLAVMVVSDAFESRSTTTDPAALDAMRFIPLGELQRKGLVGKPREVVLCTIQTPVDCSVLKQFYRREEGKIVPEEREKASEADAHKGRLFRFFDGQQEGHA